MAVGNENVPSELKSNKDIHDAENDSGNGNLSSNIDAERGGRSKFGTSDKTVGGRIAPVLPHLKGYDFGSDDSNSDIAGSDILGKQIELEAGNDIQYRTCSWQKAGLILSYSSCERELMENSYRGQANILLLDRSPPLL